MQDRVKLPAIGLIVTAALGIVLMLMGLLAEGVTQDLYKTLQIPEEQLQRMQQMQQGGTVLNIALTLVGVAGAAFVIYAAMQMMKLQSRTLAIVASVLVMIPCFTSCCCLVGIPVGIWSIVVLMKPDVKAAFTS
jgi:hypothetical protein